MKKGYDQKAQAGRGNMMKTGKGIPPQFYGPQMAEDGPGDGIKKAIDRFTGTTHRGGFLNASATGMGRSKPATDLLEVAGDAISSGVEKVKSFFNKKNKPTGGR